MLALIVNKNVQIVYLKNSVNTIYDCFLVLSMPTNL